MSAKYLFEIHPTMINSTVLTKGNLTLLCLSAGFQVESHSENNSFFKMHFLRAPEGAFHIILAEVREVYWKRG